MRRDIRLNEKVRKEKRQAREALRQFPKFELKRDVFFIHGWGDEANVCWTHPYTETGKNRRRDWYYTIKEWLDDKVVKRHERVHYVRLLKNESNAKITYDRRGKVHIDIDDDESFYFESFFEFAELLKDKVESQGITDRVDIVCHSMGGLDAVTAIAVDRTQDHEGKIKSPCLKNVNMLITVSTPHQGSLAANLSDTKLAKILLRGSKYIRIQGSNMRPTSPFITLLNERNIRNQLLERISFMHMFGGGSDPIVPRTRYKIKTDGLKKKNFIIYPVIRLASHTQRMGITQDPRMHLQILRLLAS